MHEYIYIYIYIYVYILYICNILYICIYWRSIYFKTFASSIDVYIYINAYIIFIYLGAQDIYQDLRASYCCIYILY